MRQLGAGGPSVFPIALGCMDMSGVYGNADESESIATIHAAIEQGVNLLDTGDFYGMGHNEMLIGRAIRGRRDGVLVSVKFGAQRSPDGGWVGVDARPASVKNFLAYSLKRLGVDYIDIYRAGATPIPPHRSRRRLGRSRTWSERDTLRYVGLSEVGAETVRRAHAVHPISDLQIEYSLISRSPERAILPVLKELGIGVTAYGVLSRGLLSGSKPAGQGDFRAALPRFTVENGIRNHRLVEALNGVAQEKGVTGTKMAIAWVLAKDSAIIPVMGARTRRQLAETLGALSVRLTHEDIERLERNVPASEIAGDRYNAQAMAALDSER
jgi:aryl-alcohol dehydrogenase-like predicted oxidoreductase